MQTRKLERERIMQDVEKINIDDKLKKLSDKTSSISSILQKNELDKLEIEKLAALYAERKALLSELDAWRKSEEGLKFLEQNGKKWNIFIENILDADKKNINFLKEKLADKGQKLKDIFRNKSLLIYSKDNSYGY